MSNHDPIRKDSDGEKSVTMTKKNLVLLIVAIVAVVCLCVAAVIFVIHTIQNDNPTEPTQSTTDTVALGEQMKNTIAMTVGDHSLNAVELNYFYMEIVNSFCNEYYYYIYYYGMIDVNKPLNEQYFDEEAKTTWADYFLGVAKENIKSTYLLCDLAKENGFTLPEAEQESLASLQESIEYYTEYYKYDSVNSYLEDVFGYGSDLESYLAYTERAMLADAYYSHYANSLSYTDEQLRDFEKEAPHEYNAYSYAVYFLDATKFRTGGTEDSDGKITYTDEQIAAAIQAAEEAANALKGNICNDLEAFNDLILSMDINSNLDSVSITEKTDVLYAGIDAAFQEWIIEEGRAKGEIAVFPKTSKTGEGENAKEITDGYYILWFGGVNDNEFALKDVRHILVLFKNADGKTYSDGVSTFTDEQKATAKAEAERLLAEWQAGEMTEDSFAALATKKTEDPGSAATGGLYEKIYPGQMVASFEDWCFDAARQVGDTGLVESVYGYHIMFFVGDSDITYRDYMITYSLRSADLEIWHEELVASEELVEVCLDYCKLDMKLSG